MKLLDRLACWLLRRHRFWLRDMRWRCVRCDADGGPIAVVDGGEEVSATLGVHRSVRQLWTAKR